MKSPRKGSREKPRTLHTSEKERGGGREEPGMEGPFAGGDRSGEIRYLYCSRHRQP